jgi:hypothetical protein
MSERFSISVSEWLGSTSGDPAEKVTNAELGINIGENCVTQVEDLDSRTVRSTIRVSAEPIAKWLVANWWRLRWEPEPVLATEDLDWSMAHSVAAIGGGYVWPDLVFRGSDGAKISVICKRHLYGAADSIVPIRFLNSFVSTVSAADFENGVKAFVETVLARLNSMDVKKSELHELWDDLTKELGNPKLASYRRLEAHLGLDPDADDHLVSSLLKWSKQLGELAIEEIAAASSSAEIVGILAQARDLAQKIKTFADVPGADDLSPYIDNHDCLSELAPWQYGQSLAYALRKTWQLDFSPVADSDLAERLSLPIAKLKETTPEAPFSFGYRGPSEGKLGFAVSRVHDHGRRFDIARLLGDYLSRDFNDRMMPVTNTMTARQKFQRAFAAEFLCPSAMIKERYPNGIDQHSIGKVVDAISDEYDVAEQVVRHHMENRHVLSRELIDSPLLLA